MIDQHRARSRLGCLRNLPLVVGCCSYSHAVGSRNTSRKREASYTTLTFMVGIMVGEAMRCDAVMDERMVSSSEMKMEVAISRSKWRLRQAVKIGWLDALVVLAFRSPLFTCFTSTAEPLAAATDGRKIGRTELRSLHSSYASLR